MAGRRVVVGKQRCQQASQARPISYLLPIYLLIRLAYHLKQNVRSRGKQYELLVDISDGSDQANGVCMVVEACNS